MPVRGGGVHTIALGHRPTVYNSLFERRLTKSFLPVDRVFSGTFNMTVSSCGELTFKPAPGKSLLPARSRPSTNGKSDPISPLSCRFLCSQPQLLNANICSIVSVCVFPNVVARGLSRNRCHSVFAPLRGYADASACPARRQGFRQDFDGRTRSR